MEPTRTAPKWLWSARRLPDLAKSARNWICLTDFPLVKWAGRPFICDTLASRTGCFDAVARQWIGPLLSTSHAPPLPQVVMPGDVVGTMHSPTLRDSGAVDDKTILVAGGHDHPVAAHAVHQLAASARVDSMGTANVIYGDAPGFRVDAFDPLIAFSASIEGPAKIACVGVFEFAAMVNRSPGGIGAVRHVLALPHMPGVPSAPTASSFDNERQLLEWATMNARRMLERLKGYGVPDGPIFATGGWSRSRALLELRASIFDQPVHVPEERELSVLGAALLAARAAGRRAEFQTPIEVVEPNETWRRAYAEIFEQFSAITAGSDTVTGAQS